MPVTITKIKLPHGDSWMIVVPIIGENYQMNTDTYDELWGIHPIEKGKGMMMGKEIEFPRWQQSYGQSYNFTGVTHQAKKLEHPYLKKILKWVQKHSGQPYKQMLINWYEDGNHYIGPHSDNESQLVKIRQFIVSVLVKKETLL